MANSQGADNIDDVLRLRKKVALTSLMRLPPSRRSFCEQDQSSRDLKTLRAEGDVFQAISITPGSNAKVAAIFRYLDLLGFGRS